MGEKTKPRVGVDIDGVIWELVEPWLERFNKITGDNISLSDIKTYEIEKYLNKGNKDILYYILEHSDFWESVKPYDKVANVLEVMNTTCDLYIVTSTSHRVALKKFEKFFELFPFVKPSQIITTYNKQLIDLDWLVDDYENNLIDGKYKKILITQPYNEHFNNSLYEIERVKGLWEAWELIALDIYKERRR